MAPAAPAGRGQAEAPICARGQWEGRRATRVCVQWPRWGALVMQKGTQPSASYDQPGVVMAYLS